MTYNLKKYDVDGGSKLLAYIMYTFSVFALLALAYSLIDMTFASNYYPGQNQVSASMFFFATGSYLWARGVIYENNSGRNSIWGVVMMILGILIFFWGAIESDSARMTMGM